jgi:aspartyl-tRNA(Asn)/glutamyl-tRNA(Gln) amidotransferase subunit A
MLKKSASELDALLKQRKITSKEILDSCFKTIEETDSQIKAFISLDKEGAYKQAKAIDSDYASGKKMPVFAGVPIAIKDNICTKNIRTTCASKMLENFISPYDATVIKKLKANSLIPIGKLNMDEFAMGSSCENSAFFTTKNPLDLSRVTGGSSGGSAAAVAAKQVPLTLGSDTGGSIRQPASFCGIAGIKPTYGRVSRYGLVAFASSLDQIGGFANKVEDLATLLNIICGQDSKDATSANLKVPDFNASLNQNIKGLKVGVPKELFGSEINADILGCIKKALDQLNKNGACWQHTSMPSFKHAISTYYILASAEASSNLARYDGIRYTYRDKRANNLKDMYKQTRGAGFGSEVKRRIILGTYVLSSGYYDAYYLKAQKIRTLFKQDFERAFNEYDVLITPTTPTTAFKIGENANNPLQMYLADIATIPVSLAGLPAISIPCGFVDGLPVGLQIIGKAFDEETILKVAHSLQQTQ